MRYAVISDIHSNFEALTAVLANIQEQKVQKIICLGDIVGYGPNPNECIDLIKKNCAFIITGNHDRACINSLEKENFNRFAKESIEWTVDQLNEESFSFISQHPFHITIDDFYFVHSSPHEPELWHYVLTIDQAIYNFSYFDEQICFLGHSHVPIIFKEIKGKNYNLYKDKTLKFSHDDRYLINIGSVGQSRDANPDASYGIIDVERKEYKLCRVAYDIKLTQEKMKDIGLPFFFIDRLTYGR